MEMCKPAIPSTKRSWAVGIRQYRRIFRTKLERVASTESIIESATTPTPLILRSPDAPRQPIQLPIDRFVDGGRNLALSSEGGVYHGEEGAGLGDAAPGWVVWVIAFVDGVLQGPNLTRMS
jgi:hypothetical protein